MIKKVLVVVALAASAAILVYSYYGAIPLPNMLQSTWTWAQAVWATIPAPIKGILQVVSIPSIISGVFFAWTKIRAMNKLQETQLQTSQTITQIQGEKQELEGQVKTFAEEQALMEGTYGKTFTGEIKGLATELQTTKTTLEAKMVEITKLQTDVQTGLDTRHRLEEDIRHYDNKIKTLQYQLDVAEGRITPPIQ